VHPVLLQETPTTNPRRRNSRLLYGENVTQTPHNPVMGAEPLRPRQGKRHCEVEGFFRF